MYKKILLASGLLILSLNAFSRVLPDVFYTSTKYKKSFCQRDEFRNEHYWRTLVSQKIDALIKYAPEVTRNSYVSLSYYEMFRTSTDFMPAKFMTYVYANASHHLGRLVRFNKWPPGHPLAERDRELVKGEALRLAAQNVSHELSRRLMLHSLALYKELAWSLASASVCGAEYTLSFVRDSDLEEAFRSKTVRGFIKPFVTYEQTYLQERMYSDFLIGSSARMKVLDDMRFISFNGEATESFRSWCERRDCRTSSYDLENRILFDTYSILKETTHVSENILIKRATNARITETALAFILKN